MSILFMDGCDVGDHQIKYDAFNVNLTTTTSTRYGVGQALYQPANVGSGTVNFRKSITPSAKVVVGFAYRASLAQDSVPIVQFTSDTNTILHGNLHHLASGALALYRGTTVVATSAAGILPLNTWGYLELSATVSDTVGYLECRLNGVNVASFTGDTRNAGVSTNIDCVTWIYPNTSSVPYYDDIYVLNGLGSAPNNDFLGERRVQTLRPNGAGFKTDLSPLGSPNNWDNVDEAPVSAADYNFSGTAGHQDLYALSELLAGTVEVNAVQSVVHVRKTDTSARSAKALIRSGGTTLAGPTVALTPATAVVSTISDVDPSTSAAWVPANIAALEAGVEVV